MKYPQIAKLLFIFLLILTTTHIAAAAVAVPSPIAPAAGANLAAPLTISWSAVTDPSGILGYNWQVSASSTFGAIAAQNSTNVGITQDVVSGLPNGTYFWRVQAVSGAFVQGAWYAARSFTITGAGAGSVASPVLAATKGYSTFHPFETVTFNWTPVAGAASYLLQAATDPSFPVITRIEINNIPNPTYTFVAANEGLYSARVFAVTASGVASVPSNVITYSVSYNNPISAPPAIIAPNGAGALTLPVTFTWADVLNPQPSGYELQIAKDSGFANIEIDSPQLNGPTRTELSLTPGPKFWRVRSQQGDASPTTAALTKWSATGTFSINAAPAAPMSMAFTSNPLYSGNSTWVAVQLTSAAPANGAIISLTSSNPAAAPVPATVTMPANTAWMQFQMQAGQVVSATPVTLTASLNGSSTSAQIEIMPPSLKQLIVTPNSVNGGVQPQAIVYLNGVAPAGGASVNLNSSSSAVLAPAVATIAAGDTTVSLPLPTLNVAANTSAIITASWNGQTVQAPLTLTAPAAPAATLTVTASGRSGESVTSNPVGINAAVGSSASASLATGSAVTLTVSNARTAIFSGACSSGGNKVKSCTFTMSGNATASVNVQ